MRYKFLEHTADIKFRSYGLKAEECFSNAALAMTKSFCSGKVKENSRRKIKVSGRDMESLLYNFLEELLVLFDSEHFILSQILNIKIDKKKFSLKCEVVGGTGKVHSHIKAITYNEMFVRKEKGKWVCQVVLDV